LTAVLFFLRSLDFKPFISATFFLVPFDTFQVIGKLMEIDGNWFPSYYCGCIKSWAMMLLAQGLEKIQTQSQGM
jgi:hypothetical protein